MYALDARNFEEASGYEGDLWEPMLILLDYDRFHEAVTAYR